MKRRIQEILLVLFAIAILVLPLGPALPGQAAAGAFAYADTNVDEAYDDGTEGEWNLEEEAPEEEADGEVEVLDLPDERLTERLTDDADLLTNAEEKELLAKLDEISERQKMDVVVVTTNGLDGKTATEYADDFFDYNGFGFGAGHDGILLLVSMEERDWAISTSGAGIDTFTDDGQSFMTGQIIPYLSSGDYAGAFDTYATLCDEFITQAKEGDPYDGGNMPKDPEQTRSFRLLMLPVSILIDLVHYYGGILGPAHPFGDKYLSFIDTMMRHKQQTVMQRFDFVEGFNACEGEESNRRAMALAKKYGKPTFGGSDAHRENCVGLAYTIFPEEVRCNDDLIACVKQRGMEIACGGSYYHGPVKQHMGISHAILMKLFWAYNRLGALIRRRGRNREIRNLYLQEILHKHTDS